MPPPWAAVAELRIVGRIHGSETQNVFHLATNSVVSDPSQLNALLQALVGAMKECVTEFLLPAVTQDWTFVKTTAHTLFPTLGDPVEANGVPTDVGTRGPTSVSFASTLVSLRTGIGGRRGRGRKYLPPAGEADIADSRLNDAVLVLMAAYLACVAEKFLGQAPTTDWRLGILSKSDLNAVGGTYHNSFREIVQLSPRPEVATMVSRKVGRGA